MSDEKTAEKAIPKKPSTNPSTVSMVMEAITALDDRKGASVPAMKSYIMEKYPTVDAVMLKHRMKKALEKVMVEEMITRPKTSDITGASMKGRFHLNKAKVEVAKEKPKVVKAKVIADKPKVKKPKASEAKVEAAKKTVNKPKKAAPKRLNMSKKLVKDAVKSAKKAELKEKAVKSTLKTTKMTKIAKTAPKTPIKIQKKTKEQKAPRAGRKATAK